MGSRSPEVLIPLIIKGLCIVTLTKAIDRRLSYTISSEPRPISLISPRLREPTDAVFPFTVMKLCSPGILCSLSFRTQPRMVQLSYPVPRPEELTGCGNSPPLPGQGGKFLHKQKTLVTVKQDSLPSG